MFYRVKEGKIVAGVLNGISVKYKLNVKHLRIIFCILCIPIPVLIIIYIMLWFGWDAIEEGSDI